VNQQELDRILKQTLADLRLTGSEKSAFADWVKDQKPTPQDLGVMRHHAFDAAKEAMNDPQSVQILAWLEDILKVVQTKDSPARTSSDTSESKAYFSPEDDCVPQITSLFNNARKKCDVCVFTITDDRISKAITAAHKRGVKIRIITDNEKMLDPGSDIERFKADGIALRVDFTMYHMHHKFAIFDDVKLLNGSYNWTRGAAEYNEENFLVTTEPTIVTTFQAAFERLWTKLENQ